MAIFQDQPPNSSSKNAFEKETFLSFTTQVTKGTYRVDVLPPRKHSIFSAQSVKDGEPEKKSLPWCITLEPNHIGPLNLKLPLSNMLQNFREVKFIFNGKPPNKLVKVIMQLGIWDRWFSNVSTL